tara:strand:+ start:118 stop:477 length:360 start_codon:yes stop_codon:yes gene_type:complete
MKTKNELEQAIVMHEEALESSRHSVIVDTQDLEQAKKDLANMNKPELTPMQFDDLYEAVEKGVGEYDFSDEDNFDTEFGINYDGKVHLENFDISNTQDLVDVIVAELTKLFTEAECPDA